MEASNNYPKQQVTENHRLYGGVVSILELLRVFGLIGAVFWGLAVGQIDGVLGFITFVTSGLTIYISMTSCVAIIDLLSRIELNTRKPEPINFAESDW